MLQFFIIIDFNYYIIIISDSGEFNDIINFFFIYVLNIYN